MKRALVVSGLVALVGCGVKRVPDAVLEKLPYEAKIELLEAENDLALAVDRLDEAHNEVLRTRDQLRRAKDRVKSAEKEAGNATDAVSREVAELSVAEGELRVEYLRARQRGNVQLEKIAEQNQTCAIARFEVARLAAARKAKLEGSETLDPKDFEAQVKACEDVVAALKEDGKVLDGEAATARASWDKSKESLAKKTFDARASPWVE